MLDKNPFIIDDFKGINRGSENTAFSGENNDIIPLEDALECTNLVFTKEGGLQTRPPVRKKCTLALAAGDTNPIHKHWKIARLGTTYYDNRWLYLTYDSGSTNGRLYDSGAAVPSTPILTIAGMKFASIINIYGRLYISPLSDFGVPLTGSNGVIWLYDGTTCRKAGGAAPAGATLTITDTAVGGANVTAGLHIGAIAFETSSGFITPPGPATRIQVTIAAGGGRAARFANIDVGPAGTVARHLLLTKTIPTYDGIQDNWELFFALRVADNVTTTADVVVPDTGLVDSADYLLSEKAELPSCAAISVYATHLMYNGIKTDQRVTYVSKSIDPETVDETEDYIQIFDGIPTDILNGKELRGSYYIWKENTCFVTREDPSSPPNAWQVDLVDSGLGILPMGIAEVLANPGGLVVDNLVVANMSGIFVFSGSYSPTAISYKIQAIFDTFPKSDLKYLQMSVDPLKRRLYVVVGDPLAEGERTRLYVGDYYRGLSPETIRWSRWDITLNSVRDLSLRGVIQIAQEEGILYYKNGNFNVYAYPTGNFAAKVLIGTGTTTGVSVGNNYTFTVPASYFGKNIVIEVEEHLYDINGAGYMVYVGNNFDTELENPAYSFLFDDSVMPVKDFSITLPVLPNFQVLIQDSALGVWEGCTVTVHDGPLTTDPVLDTFVTNPGGTYAFTHTDVRAGNHYNFEVTPQTPPTGPPVESGNVDITALNGTIVTLVSIVTAP